MGATRGVAGMPRCRELTETPLMLSILTLTYQGVPVEDLLREASPTDRQRQIFEHYVQRMLRQRGAQMRYTQAQTTHWLTWLARQLKQQNQTVFYIEHLQPDWLSGVRMRQAYDRWALRFPAILMGILVSLMINSFLSPPFYTDLALNIVLGGFIGWLLGAENNPATTRERRESQERVLVSPGSTAEGRGFVGLISGLSFGLIDGLFSGLISGLSYGLGGMLLQAALEKSNRAASSFQAPQRSRKPKWPHPLKSVGVRNGILAGLIVGLIVGLSDGLIVGLSSGLSDGLYNGLRYGLISGLSYGLIGGLLSVLLIGKPVGITLTDELVWSWRSLRRSLLAKRHRTHPCV